MTKANLRKQTFDYGRNVFQLRQRRRRLASTLLCLVLILTGTGLWFFPSASIALDINPSIELKINALDRVIALEGRNFEDDDLVGMNYMILGRVFKVVSMLQPTGTGMDSTFFMDWHTAQDMCLESEVLRENWTKRDPHDYISVIMIKFAEGVDPNAFVKQVEESGIEAKCLLTGETISSLQSQLEVTMKVMFALWLASLLIAVLSLVGRFNALARERKKEIGLLRAIGLKKGQVFGLIIGETCTMALMGGVLGSAIALVCMNPIIEMLKGAFKLSPSVWTTSLALLCGVAGVALAGLLGFAAAVSPALKSASMDPQAAITQGEVN